MASLRTHWPDPVLPAVATINDELLGTLATFAYGVLLVRCLAHAIGEPIWQTRTQQQRARHALRALWQQAIQGAVCLAGVVIGCGIEWSMMRTPAALAIIAAAPLVAVVLLSPPLYIEHFRRSRTTILRYLHYATLCSGVTALTLAFFVSGHF